MARADRAYLHLRTAIEQGQYPTGSALPTQPALARAMGVSTVTLRQAMERLAEEGFVEARHGHGTIRPRILTITIRCDPRKPLVGPAGEFLIGTGRSTSSWSSRSS